MSFLGKLPENLTQACSFALSPNRHEGSSHSPEDDETMMEPNNTKTHEATEAPQVPREAATPEVQSMLTMWQQFMQFCQQPPQTGVPMAEHAMPMEDQRFERFLRFRPPKFVGEPDDRKAENWLNELEKIFEVTNYSDSQKVSYAAFQLEETARHWWRVVNQKWAQNNTARTWANFVQEFNEKFIPKVVKNARERDFMNLTQGTMTVAQYEARFNYLIRYAPHYMNDETRKVRKFIEGLKLELRWAIISSDATNYSATINKAMQIESEMRELTHFEERAKRTKFTNLRGNSNRNPFSDPKYPRRDQEHFTNRNPVSNHQSGAPPHLAMQRKCGFCGLSNHEENDCRRKKGLCVLCGSADHIARDCRRRQESLHIPQGQKGKAPMEQQSKAKIPARAYALAGVDETAEPTAVVEGNVCLLGKCGKPHLVPEQLIVYRIVFRK
ncbi:PREDICTED: uncharacterized protein LOC105954689 [Erythranthe guttata]|uniref:uncharacterized protein LOC105954689 n=1 Tax=Erythranthe guttata TaxID=4155 RepID=UPI00064D74BE|nr:PREDICTED: uncharacterized protein LOC105954689 [Erythranthe guttata]|eukprot:XP_012833825.1 PREDICTED: uncharacterized protein LOC105954689 [Erythranthe guttata]